MLNSQAMQTMDRTRVSILERLIPSLSLAMVALSGSVGAAMWLRTVQILRATENAGIDAVSGALWEAKMIVIVFLAVAAILGLAGIIASAARLFTSNQKASPPGILFPVVGLISIVSPVLFIAILWLVFDSMEPTASGVASVERTTQILSFSAFAASAFAIVALLIFSFVPFSSKLGRKYLPLIFLVITELVTIVLAVDLLFFGKSSVI